jgi:hypothetical protein
MDSSTTSLSRFFIEEYIHVIQTTNGWSRYNTFQTFCESTRTEVDREFLCRPEFHLFQILRDILVSLQDDDDGSLCSAVLFLLRLSLNDSAQEIIGSRQAGFVPVLIKLMKDPPISPLNPSSRVVVSDNAAIVLSNCTLMESTHSCILSSEFEFLEYWKEKFLENPENELIYNKFAFIAAHLKNDQYIHYFHSLGIPHLLFQTLFSFGSNPHHWHPHLRVTNLSKILCFFTWYSRLPAGAKIVREVIGNSEFFLDLLHFNDKESLQSMIIAANIYGRDDSSFQFGSPTTSSSSSSSRVFKPLLEINPVIFPFLLDVFDTLMNSTPTTRALSLSPKKTAMIDLLCQKGFDYMGILIKDIASALRNLSISYENKKVMIMDFDLRKRLLLLTSQALILYLTNSDVCKYFPANGIRITLGGGGKDVETVESLLELLLQLSFLDEKENTNNSVVSSPSVSSLPSVDKMFLIPGVLNIAELLEDLLFSLPTERNLTEQAKSLASILLNRIKGTTILPSSPQPKPAQHIMLSYSSNSYGSGTIEEFFLYLKELRHDVWYRRPDTNSQLTKEYEELMNSRIRAIQQSSLVIIFLCGYYWKDQQCRLEANYARLRRRQHQERPSNSSRSPLQIIFVNLEEEKAVTIPEEWLEEMVGDQTFPLSNNKDMKAVAEEINKRILVT